MERTVNLKKKSRQTRSNEVAQERKKEEARRGRKKEKRKEGRKREREGGGEGTLLVYLGLIKTT